MTTKEKFEQLKEFDINAKNDEQRAEINKQLEQLADSDPDGFENAVLASARQTLTDVKALRIKEQLLEVSEIVSMSYIAKTYFNKTRGWLSQRINELEVNGKPAQFTPSEIDTLNAAFKDISQRIGAFHVSC